MIKHNQVYQGIYLHKRVSNVIYSRSDCLEIYSKIWLWMWYSFKTQWTVIKGQLSSIIVTVFLENGLQ